MRHAVASQFVDHDHARHVLQTLQQSAKEAPGGFGIPPLLHKNVEYNTILIHRAPATWTFLIRASRYCAPINDQFARQTCRLSWEHKRALKAGQALDERHRKWCRISRGEGFHVLDHPFNGLTLRFTDSALPRAGLAPDQCGAAAP